MEIVVEVFPSREKGVSFAAIIIITGQLYCNILFVQRQKDKQITLSSYLI